MSFSSGSSTQDLIVQQLGGTSDHGKPAMLRQLCSATSPHNNNTIAVSNVLGSIITSWGPNILCGSLLGHVRTHPNNASAFNLAINVLKAQFLQYRRRIHALEAEVEDLRHDNMMYHSDVGSLEAELSNMRVNYYSEVSQRHQLELLAKNNKEEISVLQVEITVLKSRASRAEYDKDENNLLKAEMEALKFAHSQADQIKCKELRELSAALNEERSQAELDEYEIKLLKAEIDVLKEEHRRAELDKCEIKLLKAELSSLKEEHSQAERFILAITDVKLYDSVLSDAARSVLEGGDTEDALIEAVKSASTRKGSAWSRIIPAVVGPRTPEHYLSAIDIALKARKELNERRRASSFWKFKAKANPANANVITPSSDISDICNEMSKEQSLPRENEVPSAEQARFPAAQIEDDIAPISVAPVSSDELSTSDSGIPKVDEPSDSTFNDVDAQSRDTVIISTPSLSSPDVEENEDESYTPSEHGSVETIKPWNSEAEITPIVEDVDESFAATAQNINFVEEVTQPESATRSESVCVTRLECIVQAESNVQTESNVQPRSVIQRESITDEECKSTSPSLSERPSTPISCEPTSGLTTPSKLLRSSPSKLVTPQEKARPRLISPFKSPSPSKFPKTSRVAEFLQTSRKNSELFVKPLRTLGRPTSPIRSRLSTPKNYALKRPVLQTLNLNIPGPAADACKAKDIKTKAISTVRPDFPPTHVLPKSQGKDVRKRRGVIMVEKVHIDRSLNNSAHSSTKSQDTVQAMPRFPSSASTDVFSDRRNANEMDTSLKAPREPKNKGPVSVKPISLNDVDSVLSTASASTGLQPCDQSLSKNALSPTTLMVSRLVEQFSDSDLGSLEMTSGDEDSDSDCEEIRRVQNELDDQPINLSALPHIQRILAEDNMRILDRKVSAENNIPEASSYTKDDTQSDKVDSTSSVLSGSLSAATSGVATRASRPATPYSRSQLRNSSSKDNECLTPSTSGSSYATSSFSDSDSMLGKRTTKIPLLSHARRLRHGGSATPVKEEPTPSFLPVMTHSKSPLPVVSPTESSKPLVPSTPKSVAKPLAGIWNMRNKTSDSSEDAIPRTPPRKVAVPISALHSKQTSVSSPSSQRIPSVVDTMASKQSMGQSFIRRFSNAPVLKSKTNTTAQVMTESIHLAPPTPPTPPSPGSLTKPRSHTINTVSPLPPTLSTPSPEALRAGSTKPRSHTVNTYSPTTRSPLSRLAADASAEYKVHQSQKDMCLNQISPPLKSLVPKSSSSTRTGSAVGKSSNSTLPLRVNKSSSSKRQGSKSSEKTDPAPPTAAFMRPAASPASSTTKRMTNSIAPLIPNWTPATANGGGLTPKQCRTMFRNSLSMVVR